MSRPEAGYFNKVSMITLQCVMPIADVDIFPRARIFTVYADGQEVQKNT